jgi:hypothetical protein
MLWTSRTPSRDFLTETRVKGRGVQWLTGSGIASKCAKMTWSICAVKRDACARSTREVRGSAATTRRSRSSRWTARRRSWVMGSALAQFIFDLLDAPALLGTAHRGAGHRFAVPKPSSAAISLCKSSTDTCRSV